MELQQQQAADLICFEIDLINIKVLEAFKVRFTFQFVLMWKYNDIAYTTWSIMNC